MPPKKGKRAAATNATPSDAARPSKSAKGAAGASTQKSKKVASGKCSDSMDASVVKSNPLLREYQRVIKERPELLRAFDPKLSSEVRDELLEYMGTELSDIVDRYGWSIPDERCIAVMKQIDPIVEVAGGRGYWAALLQAHGVDIITYDIEYEHENNWTKVLKGGPNVVKKHSDRALFLCYPDDFEHGDGSVAAQCLANYKGDTVVHVGELFGNANITKPSPWGRTSAPEFQEQLCSEWHCVLRLGLTSWPVCVDTFTVWRRTEVTQLDPEQGGDCAFIPPNERITLNAASPAFSKFLKQ